MKETPISNLERTFLLESLQEGKRLDGRTLDERRKIEIQFGHDYGNCLVTLGNTRVLANVTATVTEPNPSRPCEGILQISMEFSQMCAPRFSDARSNSLDDEATEAVRILERCLKESKCLDMESLCIVAEEKVWSIRLDLKVLNHEGSVADCASVAGLAALAHFRRPDATLQGDVIQIHPINERDPVPLAVHHYPVCSTFAFFNQAAGGDGIEKRVTATDPSHQEEAVVNGKLVLGVNPYREICTLHLAGQMLIEKDVVLRLAHRSGQYSKEVVDKIKSALSSDQEERAKGTQIGLGRISLRTSILANEEDKPKFDLDKLIQMTVVEKPLVEKEDSNEMDIVEVDDGLVEMLNRTKGEKSKEKKVAVDPKEKKDGVEQITIDSDSEEDEVSIVKADHL